MNRINLSESELAELAARIQRNYSYDDQKGQLVNRKTGRAVKGQKSARRNGKYHYLYFHLCHNGRRYKIQMHHMVWAWHQGRFPSMQIDHLNGDRYDNHIGNLREVSDHENKMNMLHEWNPNADTGLPGISPKKNVYQTNIHGKKFHFGNPFEAFFHATMCGKRYK